jgi:hypothetical protein
MLKSLHFVDFLTAEIKKNNLAQLITIIRTCAEGNNWVATPKANVTLLGQMYKILHFVFPP